MTLTKEEIKKLLLPSVAFLALTCMGVALFWYTTTTVAVERQRLATSQAERTQMRDRLARISEEEREVNQKIQVYRQLKALNVIGPERRLDWTDAMARIKASRELLDVRYRVDRQNMISSVPGKPGSVDFYASTMKVDLALLHELDLLRFLGDLRESGNAYYAVRRCGMSRTAQPVVGTSIAPRMLADCEIDLITIHDRGAKS